MELFKKYESSATSEPTYGAAVSVLTRSMEVVMARLSKKTYKTLAHERNKDIAEQMEKFDMVLYLLKGIDVRAKKGRNVGPSAITYLYALRACKAAGKGEHAESLFTEMQNKRGRKFLTSEHYEVAMQACMVREGTLETGAMHLKKNHPFLQRVYDEVMSDA